MFSNRGTRATGRGVVGLSVAHAPCILWVALGLVAGTIARSFQRRFRLVHGRVSCYLLPRRLAPRLRLGADRFVAPVTGLLDTIAVFRARLALQAGVYVARHST